MLILKSIGVRRFKGVVDAVLDLDENLNILIGPNGTGKSTLLQTFSFIRAFATGATEKLLDDRLWSAKDLKSKSSGNINPTIAFDILLSDSENGHYFWQIRWNANTGRTQNERLWFKKLDEKLIELYNFDNKKGLSIDGEDQGDTLKTMRASSSVLELFIFKDKKLGYDSELVEEWANGILSLELLSTTELRRSSRTGDDAFGIRGEKFASFLDELGPKVRENLVGRVNRFYPIKEINVKRKRAGWTEMSILDGLGGFEVSSSHISDGVLRMIVLASLAEAKGKFSIVLIDEVEDGIEPHHLKFLVEDLREDVGCQVLATSHSPVIANFSEPNEISMVWRDKEAQVFTVPVSELNIFKDEHLGIGEAWLSISNKAIEKTVIKKRPKKAYPIGDRATEWDDEVKRFFKARGIR